MLITVGRKDLWIRFNQKILPKGTDFDNITDDEIKKFKIGLIKV